MAESSTEAAVSAAAAAVASAVAETSDGLPSFARARIVWEAAIQLFEAARLLQFDLLLDLFLWARAHPRVALCIAAMPASWIAYKAAHALANASWRRGLRDEFQEQRDSSKKSRRWTSEHVSDVGSQQGLDDVNDDSSLSAAGNGHSSSWPLLASCEDDCRESDPVQRLRPDGDAIGASSPVGRSPTAACFPEVSDNPLASCSALAGLGEECLTFLAHHVEIIPLEPGAAVFEAGSPRDAFIMIRSGQVIVDAHPNSREEYILVAGDLAVGLLFVLASIDADKAPEPRSCYLHNSSAHAGASGAEIISVPVAAFSKAYDRFPTQMLSMTQLLCTRLGLVVFETLSTYFGIRGEVFSPQPDPLVPELASDDTVDNMSPAEIFVHKFGCAGDVDPRVVEIFNSATIVERDQHEQLLPRNQRSTNVLVLLEGEVYIEVSDAPDALHIFPGDVSAADAIAAGVKGPGSSLNRRRLLPGDTIGELSVFTDRPFPLVFTAETRCRFASLSRDAMQRLLELRPRVCCLNILDRIASRTASWLHRVDAALDWIHLEGGRCLYRRGDPMRGFFVVLSGRLMVLEESSSGTGSSWQVVDSMQRGSLCGELDCLRNEPYSQMVRAVRDTEVCRISPTLLKLVSHEFPPGILHFSALLGRKSSAASESSKLGSGARDRATIAVVPATSTVPVNAVCFQLCAALSKIAKTLHISPDMDLASPGTSGIQASSEKTHLRGADDGRLARVLSGIEERCHWVIYEAEPIMEGSDKAESSVSAWTRRCVRQADLILVAIDFDGNSPGDVPQTQIEEYLDKATPPHVERHLLMLHQSQGRGGRYAHGGRAAQTDLLRPGLRGLVEHHTMRITGLGSGRMRAARHYLHARPWARRWYHVREGEAGDWARCGRLLVGRGIGLCLGGGGARGNVHLGLIRAMQELNIPIDVVSGTSFGALVGGIYAMTAADPASMPDVVRQVMGNKFSTKLLMMDMNFPRTSYFTGGFLNNILQHTFARRRCEDLLVPFACTSTDIAHFNSRLHRNGPLWRIVRASMSLVGLVPPLPYSEKTGPDGQDVVSLLVDGGYTNQWPVKELRELGAGTVVCAVASPEFEPICKDYGDTVRGGLCTLRRACSCQKRKSGVDPPALAEIQERLMFLVDAIKEQSGEASTKVHADIMLRPPISDFGLLDFQKFAELDDLGYKYSLPKLQTWLAEDSPAARWVRDVIETEKQLSFQVSRSLHETEYGGRHAYRVMRQKTGALMRRAGHTLRSMPREMRSKAGSIRVSLSPEDRTHMFRSLSPMAWRRQRSRSPSEGAERLERFWRPWQRGRSKSPEIGAGPAIQHRGPAGRSDTL